MTPEQFYDKVKEFGIELTEEQNGSYIVIMNY